MKDILRCGSIKDWKDENTGRSGAALQGNKKRTLPFCNGSVGPSDTIYWGGYRYIVPHMTEERQAAVTSTFSDG